MGCCQNSSLGPEVVERTYSNEVVSVEPHSPTDVKINDRLRQSVKDSNILNFVEPSDGMTNDSHLHLKPSKDSHSAETFAQQKAPVKIFEDLAKAPSVEIELQPKLGEVISNKRTTNEVIKISPPVEDAPAPKPALKLFSGLGKAAKPENVDSIKPATNEVVQRIDPVIDQPAQKPSLKLFSSLGKSVSNAKPIEDSIISKSAPVIESAPIIEAKAPPAASLKFLSGLVKKPSLTSNTESKPIVNGNALKLFQGLVKNAAQKVVEEAEKVDLGKMNDKFLNELDNATDFIDSDVKDMVKDGIKRSVTMIGNQIAIIKEGLEETLNMIKDLNLKKRVTDIVYPMLRKVFIHSTTCRIESKYEIQGIIGQGSYSTVRKAVDNLTKIERAAKILVKGSISDKQTSTIIDEVEALKTLDHPNIIRVVEIIEDLSKLYIITELCTGGELFDRIITTSGFDEGLASHLMYQLLSGLIHIHKSGFIHRDLKPENILFLNSESNSIKIIDFGLTKTSAESKKLTRCIGTAYYVAPEVIEGKYDAKCDVWSCGVILYIMLCGSPPFGGNSEKEIFGKISRGVFKYSDKKWKTVSSDAKDLLQKMLCKDIHNRFTAEEAWNHPWVQNSVNHLKEFGEINPSTMKHLAGFRANTRLQQATLTYIASNMTSSHEIEELRKAFVILDTNGDGHLTELELSRGFDNISISSTLKLENIFERCDIDLNGLIDYSEFITAAIDWQKHLSHEMLESAFKAYDTDNNGKISLYELKEFLGNGQSEIDDVWIQLLEDADSNGDGVIDLEEFKELMLKRMQ